MSIKFKCECLLDSCSRKEGVTVGGLSLAASYMAQVKQSQLMNEVLRPKLVHTKPICNEVLRRRFWSNIGPPPPSHPCSATSRSTCANTLTLPLGTSTADYTSQRFTQTSAEKKTSKKLSQQLSQHKHRLRQKQRLGNRLDFGSLPGTDYIREEAILLLLGA